MGTISDKLMRVINTKEDIRQALISKGYDVPTSIPFKEYAKMILDLPCKADSFPDIEGIVARYYASGLTNEQMAANPVWVDKTGNGHDLQMKNFAWSGMSGCGGYSLSKEIFSYTPAVYSLNFTNPSVSTKEYDVYFQLIGLDENSGVTFNLDVRESGTAKRIKRETYTKDGIYHFEYKSEDDTASLYMIGYNGDGGDRTTFTVKILPYYAGALVFDGVDDYGVCDNFPILTKEKGYTVVALRQWISMGEGISGLVSNVKNWFNDGAFVLEYNSNNATNKFVNRPVSFGNVNIEMDLPNNFTYQTSKSYKGVPITTGSFKGTNSPFVGKLNNIIGNCSNVAIWELVFLDHDATEEELTKIKDYFVKTYPWLFFDQAWTVTGKTNEDADRDTIANITGNGNDLVLSNFGFAEGSGYNEEGEYAGYLVTDGVDDKITSSAFKMGKDFTVVGEWKFLKEDVIKLAGFVKYDAFMFYNYSYNNRINIYIYSPQGVAFNNVDTIKAVTSEGQIYFDFNSIKEVKPGDLADKGYVMNIGHNGSNHTKLALKNFAIYPTVLSKDDCIKAYNYLQTLKSK